MVYLGWTIAPSYASPNAGKGCGVSANEYSSSQGAQINFGDLTPLCSGDKITNFEHSGTSVLFILVWYGGMATIWTRKGRRPLETTYIIQSMNRPQGHLKKYILKNKVRRLVRPRSIHLCHQKPNPARETVPLKWELQRRPVLYSSLIPFDWHIPLVKPLYCGIFFLNGE